MKNAQIPLPSLRFWRVRYGDTQQETATFLGMDRWKYARRETGEIPVTLDEAQRLAHRWGIPLDWLHQPVPSPGKLFLKGEYHGNTGKKRTRKRTTGDNHDSRTDDTRVAAGTGGTTSS